MFRSKIVTLLSLVFLSGVTIGYQACGVLKTGGTSTGNPMGEPGGTVGGGAPEPHVPPVGQPNRATASGLLNALCVAISRCHSGSDSSVCLTQILSDPKIPGALGAPEGVYSNMSNAIEAEATQQLVAIGTRVAQCQAGLEALSCSDPSMSNALIGGSDYSSSHWVFQTVAGCSEVY